MTDPALRRSRPRLLKYESLVMNGSPLVLAFTLVLTGCDPNGGSGDDAEAPPPGVLEYQGQVSQIYRDGRRVDVIPVSEPNRGPGCGYLTDRALRDVENALAALEPSVDYDFERGDQECTYTDSPAAEVHVAGFEHSPFSCDSFCCRPELMPIATVYFHVANNLDGMVFEVDGEPYVAIEPDQECP